VIGFKTIFICKEESPKQILKAVFEYETKRRLIWMEEKGKQDHIVEIAPKSILTAELCRLADEAYLKKEMKIFRYDLQAHMELTKNMYLFYYNGKFLALVLCWSDDPVQNVWKTIRPVDSAYPEKCEARRSPPPPPSPSDLWDGPVLCGYIRDLKDEDSSAEIKEEYWKIYLEAVGECVDNISTKNGIPEEIKPALFIESDLSCAIKKKVASIRFGY
jgi:hypothetical protein